MLPAMIRAELNYITADSCVTTPSVCLYRSHTRFFLLFAARRCCCLFFFSLTSLQLKSGRLKSIAFTQFISGQISRVKWNGGTCTTHGHLNSCRPLLINKTADTHPVEWKSTAKQSCWIIDSGVLHYLEQHWCNSRQTIILNVTEAASLYVTPL